jgi:hypothetical protein
VYKNHTAAHFGFVMIEGLFRRTRYGVAVRIKNTLMTGAFKYMLLRPVVHGAAQVGADRSESNNFPAILPQQEHVSSFRILDFERITGGDLRFQAHKQGWRLASLYGIEETARNEGGGATGESKGSGPHFSKKSSPLTIIRFVSQNSYLARFIF